MTRNPYLRAEPPVAPPTGIRALDRAECWRLLESAEVARLAVVDEQGADIFPINYLVNDGSLFFRSAPGTKIVSLTEHPSVAVEIDGADERERWSVVVRGEAHRLDDDTLIGESGVQGLQTMTSSDKWNYFEIVPRTVTGIRFRRG
ncbi:pyridoxamine 5'-phosphate oxidase family protein [Compostimonas suwonensis]|uniref:Pyridoxamine 5'-phosphate oxidase-like protein n=1 Tax=Compostimonas suwonensis TaxID=1048394 RepID=A0A2M9C0B7_9MICO|nr:pyridoxamine 5'-phosphate oxidase family protein [Compostimonas suwonensis]PJJ63781.1 pyridoxamine 5'-phosphate oxidase-like protein [Compostimonas suwonensis]